MPTFTKEFTVKFHGIRGSHPTPAENKLKYGGNTACVEIKANGHIIILDAGTGIINLGDELMCSYIASGTNDENRTPIKANLFISHSHYDHIQGLPFFKPAFLSTSKINIFGSPSQDCNFKNTIAKPLYSPYFPLNLDEMNSDISVYDYKPSSVAIFEPNKFEPTILTKRAFEEQQANNDNVVIECIKSQAHPKDGVLVFKITCNGKSLIYATDVESYVGGNKRIHTIARNADILIHDAQYTMEDYSSSVAPKQGFGHSTPNMAIENAKLSNVKKLILFHIDPAYEDDTVDAIEMSAKNIFPNSKVANEGLEINLL